MDKFRENTENTLKKLLGYELKNTKMAKQLDNECKKFQKNEMLHP